MSQETTNTSNESNRPSHRVTFRSKFKDGYGKTLHLGGAWVNSAGGVSFPAFGGQITVWPATDKEDNGS